MASGFHNKILRVNLTKKTIKTESPGQTFFRKYLGGGAIGAYFLLKEGRATVDALSPDNLLTIAPGVTTGARVSGVSRCSVTAISPLTNCIGDGQAGGMMGPAVKNAGFDAIVIDGKSQVPVYLLIEKDNIAILDATHLTNKNISNVYDSLIDLHGKKGTTIIQCGPAGEKMVKFANVWGDLDDTVGRNGLGAVFGSKNLRAIVIHATDKPDFANQDELKKLAKLAVDRLPSAGFPTTLKDYGTPGVVSFQAESGNFATHNHSRAWTKDYKKLDGSFYQKEIGAGKTTCYGCIIACRKKVKAQKPYKVSDKMGGPEFETLGLLGSNLDIIDPVAVSKANEMCNEAGIDTITMGSIAGYIFESVENGLIDPLLFGDKPMRFGHAESLFQLIEITTKRIGIGDTIASGFEAMIKKFGSETAKFAIIVKGQGFAVHMPQVKPSQALMYAVSPIGPDHQSSEHDWLLASDSEETKGLGIIGKGDAYSTNTAKVRMTVYSQYYYSLLDALSLCMFVWGPGNIYKYQELVELVNATTGWETTFFELMKAGERRINLMKQINVLRGFKREHDNLPERMFEPLPDGPSKGHHVEKESFKNMLDKYYGLMGWNLTTGAPTFGKLLELGLEWTTN